MKNLKITTIVFCAFFSAATLADAQAAPTTAEFLLLNPSARAAGSGGAALAALGEPDALALNPAVCAGLKDKDILSASYSSWIQNVAFGSLAFARPFSRGVIGFQIVTLGASGIERRDAAGALLDEKSSIGNTSFAVNYGRALSGGILAGANVKILTLDYAGVRMSGAAFDIGAVYDFPDGKTRLGAAAQNAGADINDQKLPLTLRVSASHNFAPAANVEIFADADYPVHLTTKPKIGAQYSFPKHNAAVRLGWEFLKGLGGPFGGAISFGAGCVVPVRPSEALLAENTVSRPLEIRFDYAATHLNDLGLAHRVTLGVEF